MVAETLLCRAVVAGQDELVGVAVKLVGVVGTGQRGDDGIAAGPACALAAGAESGVVDCVLPSASITLPFLSTVMVPNVFGGAPVPGMTLPGSPLPESMMTSSTLWPSPAAPASAGAALADAPVSGVCWGAAAATLLSLPAPASDFCCLPPEPVCSSCWKRNSLSSCCLRICSCICRTWKFSSSILPFNWRIWSSSAVVPAVWASWTGRASSFCPNTPGRPIDGRWKEKPLSCGVDDPALLAEAAAPDNSSIASVPLRISLKCICLSPSC